jgi:carboxylesterase
MKGLDTEKTASFTFDRGATACLLIHGFTGSPCVLRGLGEYLAERDLTVVCNRLPGHGTSPREMLGTGWRDWYSARVEDLLELSARSERVFLCRASMGGRSACIWPPITRPGARWPEWLRTLPLSTWRIRSLPSYRSSRDS